MGAVAILGLFIILAVIGLLMKLIFSHSLPISIVIALAWIIALIFFFISPPIIARIIKKLKNQTR